MKTKILHNTFFLFMLNCSYFHKTRHCPFSFHRNTEISIVACGVENDNSLFEWVLNNILWFQRADKHDLPKSFLFIFNWDYLNILYRSTHNSEFWTNLFYFWLSTLILFRIHPFFCFLCVFLLLCHEVFHVDFKNKLVRLYKIFFFFIILYVYFKDLAN